LFLLTLCTNLSAQNKVVVIPLGGDVSAQKYNDLINEVRSQRVYSDVILSNGVAQNPGPFDEASRVSEGVYRVRVVPPVITQDFGDPAIVITSRGVHRVPAVTVSKELIDDQILYVEFDVYLRTTTGILADSTFSFHLQFADAK